MSEFGFILENEIQKILTNKRLLISLVAIVVAVLVMAVSLAGDPTNENWREYLEKQIIDSQEWIAELSTDLNENRELIVEEQQIIALYRYQLDNNYPPTESVFKFVFDSLGMESILILLTITTTAFVVCNEYTNRTILPLLTSGYRRRDIVIAKILVAAIYSVMILIAYFVISVVVGIIFFSKNGFATTYLVIENNAIVQKDISVQIISAFAIVLLRLITYLTITFCVAVITKSQTATITAMIIIWILGGASISILSIDYRWIELILLYSLEVLSDSLTTHISWASREIQHALMNCLVSSLLFIATSILGFCRKPLPNKAN